MPVISPIGRRSLHIRIVLITMYVLLTLGAVTMVYPFLLMISGSFKSEVDTESLNIVPAYWFDDEILYRKYLEARYVTVDRTEPVHHRAYGSWENVEPPEGPGQEWVNAYRAYRAQADWPVNWYAVAEAGGTGHRRYFRRHARGFRQMMRERFDGDLDALNAHYRTGYLGWEQVSLLSSALHSRRFRAGAFTQPDDFQSAINEYKAAVPPEDRVPVNLDGYFWHTYLRIPYPTLEIYNRDHGTEHADYRRIVLSRRVPREAQARQDWEQFVRDELNLSFIRLDSGLADAYRELLTGLPNYPNIAAYNRLHDTTYESFAAVPFPVSAPGTLIGQDDWSMFLGDREACPSERIEVYGPRQHFLDSMAPEQGGGILPLAEADRADFLKRRKAIRWEEIRRNYIHITDYVLLHGRATWNTVIYCALTILTTLLINPLAAYGLSRYRLPSQYKILLICMATMAFPAEVTMIPSFLLLKRFPLWNLLTGCAAAALVLYIGFKVRPRGSEAAITLLSIAVGVFAGWSLAPAVAGLFGYPTTHVSTLNTFWALILPSMANGYGIFLLKGFFDSLPRDLYDMADIDGAGAWTQFWTLTVSLSKPILAVLALSAFTAAYSEFMMALIIIPDRDMWTLMVWIFQLQLSAPRPVIQTSVLLAGIPTLIVFIFCQNIIIRGIVVPVEK
jgi:multiple sugar transport system permease protein